MENKIYFTVQDVKRENLGYGTYNEKIIGVTHYKEEDIKKALKHYKKRKANQIFMNSVEYLEDAPYVKTVSDSGEEDFVYENGIFREFVVFKFFGKKFEM